MAFPHSPLFPQVTPKAVRRIVLEQAMRAHVGHIGSALSVADILAVIFSGRVDSVMDGSVSKDRFVLGKGHAALALYAALHLQGRMTAEVLDGYCGNGGTLGVHPERELDGVEFSSGSLGQGLSVACGAALAKRLKGEPGRVRVLISDAELNEGSTWEAIMFAAHRKLDNLDVIVDVNGQQALGMTKDVMDLTPLVPRWQSFGWEVRQADGHDTEALVASLGIMAKASGRPQVLLARTMSGKGVGFMEGQIKWHYWPLSDSDFTAAMAEVERAA
ncbi:MAG: transketolase, beta subunit [Fibrobacteres bacterium]|nr:transketolase, beta subunit [Fibrobacterota bacterium]